MGAFPDRIVLELATEDPSSFMEYLRMDEEHFNHLVALVSPLIKKEDTCMTEAISPAERVTLTLRFFGHWRVVPFTRLSVLHIETCHFLH